ncbi:MAG: hypothetical protein AAGC53_07440 [Actinomycetota bacterium]
MSGSPLSDPVLERRARASRLADVGQRVGYGLFGLAIVLFFIGLIGEFSSGIATAIIGCVVVGSVVLAPAIVVGYAVKAAVRDDLEHGRAVD